MSPSRRLLGVAGLGLVLLGVVVLPAVLPPLPATWAGQFVILAGWTALVLAAGPLAARLVRPAILLSATVAAFVGFAVIFDLPLFGEGVPRTLGLVAVLLAVLTIGWLVLRGVGRVALLLTAAIAGLAALGQLLLWVGVLLLPPGELILLPVSGPANAARWTTLSLCALVAVVIGVRRLDLTA
ncbi:MAG: hypothetical protein RMM58_08865 [Chloroflexota bacterium]|nr:hypothetical protein [Dehalococcoidia bacterium]MDW8253976.1 hypothetical protein [Chloroflexota bacterium]